jgi:hypothetical protein
MSILHGSPLLALLASGAVTRAVAQDAALIAAAQQVSMISLDSTYAKVPFEKWLAELGRVPASVIRWEVNDCGEGGDGRAAPTCVEASLDVAPQTTVYASLIVAAVDGSRSTPAIWMLYARVGTNPFTTFTRLNEWVAYVHAHRP